MTNNGNGSLQTIMLICLIVMTIATVVLAFLYFGGQDSIEAASFIGGNENRKPIVDWHLKTGVSSPNNFVRLGRGTNFLFCNKSGTPYDFTIYESEFEVPGAISIGSTGKAKFTLQIEQCTDIWIKTYGGGVADGTVTTMEANPVADPTTTHPGSDVIVVRGP